MGYDESTVQRVRRLLSGKPGVVEKKMVGGLSFMVNGSMCCGVTGTALMIRVGAEARDRALTEPYVRPMEFAGRPLAGFVCVEPDGFKTEEALESWVQRGIDFVSTTPGKKRAPGRTGPMAPRR